MEITSLGQAGLLIVTNKTSIIVDPYLSNNVAKFEPQNERRQPVNKLFFKIRPDVLLITHNHLDHYDVETLKHFLKGQKQVQVLCPKSVFDDIQHRFPKNEYFLMEPSSSWKKYEIEIIATKAKHSDKYAIGFFINAESKNMYISGDTLFNQEVVNSIPNKTIDLAFLPINGVGNNMNAEEAAKFAKLIKAKNVIPYHYQMFDDINPEILRIKNKIVLLIFKTISF